MREIKDLGGYKFEVDPDVLFGQWILGNGLNFEKHLVDWLRGYLKPGMTILDIGAQWGYYSVVCPMLLKNQCRVFAIEPNYANYRMLLRNMELNGLDGIVTLIPVAASDKWGMLYYNHPKDWTGHVLEKPQGPDAFPVVQAPLDEVLPPMGRLDFIKLDIEGHEAFALLGLQKSINQHRPYIHVEVNITTSDNAGVPFMRPIEFLESYGYVKFILLEKDPGDFGEFSTSKQLEAEVIRIHVEKQLNVWDVIAVP